MNKKRVARLAALTPEERRDSLLRLTGYLYMWGESLRRQGERITETNLLKAQPDTWLYASGLGALLRCVGLAADLGADVDAALAAFDAAAPDAAAVRDVLEHLEDYELGLGRRQKPGQGRLEFMWEASPQERALHLQGVGFVVEFESLRVAVAELVEAALEAVDRARR